MIGIGITSIILLYMSFKLDPQHNFLKIFTIFFAVAILFIIPRVLIDYPTNCSIVVSSQNVTSKIISATVTYTNSTLGYTTFCSPFKDSATILLSSQMWLFYILMIYILFYGGYYAWNKFSKRGRL